ncbi:hypothetical protein QYZ44_17090 [Vibrio parahaemolyticus]|nr:hypothetical protein [Vibrio parahaemolyticus]MDN4710921.1 hypothetical protein [Vibrio parahaemolyticus]MDN4710929.1 hypothetical protein [Vibrio parahaemolyticus]MDN4735350.1 hypothetical protein [Vibrio parahaemolyticus]
MAQYFLSYDLVDNRDYSRINKALESFNAIRVLESVWCFNRFDTDAEKLRNYFGRYIDSDDRLLVIESNDWAGRRLLKSPNDL